MILVKVRQPPDRYEMYKEAINNKWQKEELDFLLKIREKAQLRNKKQKALIAWAINWEIKVKKLPRRITHPSKNGRAPQGCNKGKLVANKDNR